jgi:2'-5' RNA ligase superfamily
MNDQELIAEAYTRIYTEDREPSRSCIMAQIKEEDRQPILDFVNSIADEDLYIEDGPDHYGKEVDCHVTILYGLEPNVSIADIAEVLQDVPEIQLTLGEISTFSNDDKPYDVLKVDVNSNDLNALNKEFRKLPYENDYPKYTPHLTLAYVKKGKAEKYLRNSDIFDGEEFLSDTIEVSFGDGRDKEFLTIESQ